MKWLSIIFGMCVLYSAIITGYGYGQVQRPNFVFILADDLGYAELGCFGSQDIRTPVLDKLATEGIRLTTYYANAPNCTPTRAGFMTGRYQQRVGGLECPIGVGNVGRYDDAIRLANQHDLGLPVEETSIARMLKEAGYTTAITGKWHLGYESKFSPNRHGFDYAFYAAGGEMDYFHYTEQVAGFPRVLYRNGIPVNPGGYVTDLFTDEAIQFIERQTLNTPFFLYVPYTAPHLPYQGPNDYRPEPLPLDSDLWRQGYKGARPIYIAMVERMDQCVGRILEALDHKGFRDNTIVVFSSDNGATSAGKNTPWRGYKSHVFEGGIRVPCIIRWPLGLPEGVESTQPTIAMDFTASFARLAGVTPSSDRSFDGMDIIQHLQEGRPDKSRTLFWRARRGSWTRRAVRDNDMKYIKYVDGDEVTEYLFDLAADPSETDNLIDRQPQETERLKGLLVEWENEVQPHR